MEKNELFKGICKCKLFEGVDIETLLDKIHYRIRTYEAGHLVAYHGEPCDELLILTEGTISAEISNLKGNIVKIADITAPNSLATAFLFGEEQFFPVNIVPKGQVKVLRIPKDVVLKMFEFDKVFLNNYLNQISTRAQYLTEKLKFISFQTIKGKLAYYLMKTESEQNKKVFRLQKTQGQIAQLFGVTRPSLGRCFKQLSDEGCIKVKRKEVEIIDRKKLASYLEYEDKLHD